MLEIKKVALGCGMASKFKKEDCRMTGISLVATCSFFLKKKTYAPLFINAVVQLSNGQLWP
jgi:hypothetical protein